MKALDIRKTPPRVLAAIALTSATVLFAPEKFVAALGLLALRQDHRPWFGGPLLVSLVILICWPVGKVVRWRIRRWNAVRKLHCLAPDQKALLRRFIDEDVSTIHVEFEDADAQGLHAMGLLHRHARFTLSNGLGFMLQPWMRLYLKKHPEVLDGAAPPKKRLTGRI